MHWTMQWHESESEEAKLARKDYEQDQRAKLKAELIAKMLAKCRALGGVFPTGRQIHEDRTLNYDEICALIGEGRYEKVKQVIAYRYYVEERKYLKDSNGQPIDKNMPVKPKRHIAKPVEPVKVPEQPIPEPKEVTNMARGGKPAIYTYADVWAYVKKYDLAHKTHEEQQKIRKKVPTAPSQSTIQRLMGPKFYWAAQVACATAEEAQELLKRQYLNKRVKKEMGITEQPTAVKAEAAPEPAEVEPKTSELEASKPGAPEPTQEANPGAITATELVNMLESSGFIDQIVKASQDFSATWEVLIGGTVFSLSIKK